MLDSELSVSQNGKERDGAFPQVARLRRSSIHPVASPVPKQLGGRRSQGHAEDRRTHRQTDRQTDECE